VGLGTEDVERALPTVGERQTDGWAAAAFHPARECVGGLMGREAAAELVGAADDGSLAGHGDSITVSTTERWPRSSPP
jgi:hypothetical protein